jgi:hypothetical protein
MSHRTDRQVNDYASVLTDADKATIRSVQTALLRDRGTELVVVTINSVNDYDVADKSIEAFATNLFNNCFEIGCALGLAGWEAGDSAQIAGAQHAAGILRRLGDSQRILGEFASLVYLHSIILTFITSPSATGQPL